MNVWVGKPPVALLILLVVAVPCGADDRQRTERYGDWLAKMAAFHGSVETQRANRPRQWESAVVEENYFDGDRVRTGPRSRAQLQLRKESYLALDQNTTAAIGYRRNSDLPEWLDLVLGRLHIRSRQPRTLDITTPYVNAVHRGTEFQVEVQDQATVITVFDGEVEAKNEHGVLSLTKGQSAIARKGEAPRLYTVVKPEDAVQWALYYPPVIDFGTASASDAPDLVRGLSRYRRNDIPGALALLDAVPVADRTSRFLNLRAGLLLTVGRLDEAEPDIIEALLRNPTDATALAQQAVIAVARNRKDDALRLAQAAVAADGRSSSAKLALSYALQARFELNAARDVIRTAHQDDPKNALVLTRLAELELSLGAMDEGEEAATEALRLNPKQGRAKSLLGFAQLMQMDTDEAIATFNQAVADDPSDPLGRFGLGLAKIRKGDLEEGTVELETAASLNPDDPLIRSYLGKAYYEQKRSEPAATEYQIAKDLDPKDPTPYFYDAIKKQTENRPVEALRDLQRAVELNGNRTVYRSKQLLDSDLAARSASLGRIYNNLTFQQQALPLAWNSLNRVPTDYSSHRLLADNYAKLRRHEIARASELFQSQMLQPANLVPIQSQLMETNLAIPLFWGSGDQAFNEFNPLFQRNGFSLRGSAVIGDFDTFSEESIASGINDRFSYSLSQFQYRTDGFRENNDLRHNIYSGFAQYQLTPDLAMIGEFRHRDTQNGDLRLRFEDTFSNKERNRLTQTLGRMGAHWKIDVRQDLLGSLSIQDRHTRKSDEDITPDIINTRYTRTNSTNLNGELAYIFHADSLNIITGGSFVGLSKEFALVSDIKGIGTDTVNGRRHDKKYPKFFTPPSNTDFLSIYNYSHITFFKDLNATIALNLDRFRRNDIELTKVNPKLGITFAPFESTTIRAAWFKTFKRPLAADQTLEPTHIAGFNQFFDDIDGAQSTRYGVGLDHHFSPTIAVGLEGSWRNLRIPIVVPLRQNDDDPPETLSNIIKQLPTIHKNQREQLHRAYINWAPLDEVSIGMDYFFDGFIDPVQDEAPGSQKRRLDTHRISLSLSYFGSSGFFSTLAPTFANQDIAYKDSHKQDNASFFIFDANLGYRLPNRYGIITIGAKNLFNKSFHIDDVNVMTSDPLAPLFIPKRYFYGQITLAL